MLDECVLTSGEGEAYRRRLVETARELGVSLRPVELQWCQACRNNHMIQLSDEEVVNLRYGQAPVDVPVPKEPEKYVSRSYCGTCFAYHASEQGCSGQRQAPEDWVKKEITW